MSKLDELIAELCPDGVEYKKIKETADTFTGLTYKPGDVTKAGTLVLRSSNIQNSRLAFDDNVFVQMCNIPERAIAKENDILICVRNGSRRLIGKAALIPKMQEKLAFGAFMTVLRAKPEIIDYRYLFHVWNSQEVQHSVKGDDAMPINQITNKEFDRVNIPVPPLLVQREIVRILDNFTDITADLIAELTAELTARKKQYEYYLNTFFKPDGKTQWKEMEEEFPFIRNGFVGTATPYYTNEDDGIRYLQGTNIHNGVISDNKSIFITREFHEKHIKNKLKEDDILMVQSGHVGECAVVGDKYKGTNCHALIIMSNGGNCDSRYISYYFNSPSGQSKLQSIATGETVKHILASKMKKFLIPVPQIDEQRRVVEILERFNTLCNDITTGLPAEIEARQKQYEYYRDKLLTFKQRS